MKEITGFRQHHASSLLEIKFNCGFCTLISYELLRVYSPITSQVDSFNQQAPLVTNKAFVRLTSFEQHVNGATFGFDDGHASNHYSANYLYQLCHDQDTLWISYLNRTKIAQQAKKQQVSFIQVC